MLLVFSGSRSPKPAGTARSSLPRPSLVPTAGPSTSPPSSLLGTSFYLTGQVAHSILLTSRPYLIRHEIIAMHDPDDPQVYPVCFQANLLSDGDFRPADTVTFPAAYSINEDFKSFNLYYGSDFNAFTPPGPAVYSRSGGSAPAPAPNPPAGPSSAPAAPSDETPAPTTTLITSGAYATGSGGHCRRK